MHEAKNNINEENATNSNKKQIIPLMYEIPKGLIQYYMIIKLEDKLDTLFSFLKTHTRSKSLVFFSSIKQVNYMI